MSSFNQTSRLHAHRLQDRDLLVIRQEVGGAPSRTSDCVNISCYDLRTMNPFARRDLLKLSPLALASTVGHVSFAQASTEAHASTTEAFFNVRTFGATGDGKTVDSPAVNKAIEAVAAAGGGTLVFPGGDYLCFTLRLKS